MNGKYLVLTSFLIALFCHIIFFNFFTIIFPIEPAPLKPKLYFLGSILKKNDLKKTSEQKVITEPYTTDQKFISGKHIPNNADLPSENPFNIKPIKKPLILQAPVKEEKINIKSTFEIESAQSAETQAEAQPSSEIDLKIKPYRSLQFKKPANQNNLNQDL